MRKKGGKEREAERERGGDRVREREKEEISILENYLENKAIYSKNRF